MAAAEQKIKLTVVGDSHFRDDRDFGLGRIWQNEVVTGMGINRQQQNGMTRKWEVPNIRAFGGQGIISMQNYILGNIAMSPAHQRHVIYVQLAGNDL